MVDLKSTLVDMKLPDQRPSLAAAPEKKKRRKGPGPGPGRPTRLQAEQRNLELLDKALDLFLENGYERASMEGIAAAVGMAKRTVYAQYADKKALFMTSLKRAIDEWIVPVDVLKATETDDFEDTLQAIGKILVDNIMTREGLRLLQITNAEASRTPEISAYTYRQGTGPTLDYLADLFIRRSPRTLAVEEAKEAALAFLYLVVGGPANMSAWGVADDREQITRHTRYSVNLFLHGLLSSRP